MFHQGITMVPELCVDNAMQHQAKEVILLVVTIKTDKGK